MIATGQPLGPTSEGFSFSSICYCLLEHMKAKECSYFFIMSHLLLELGPFLLKETSSFLQDEGRSEIPAYSLAWCFVVLFGFCPFVHPFFPLSFEYFISLIKFVLPGSPLQFSSQKEIMCVAKRSVYLSNQVTMQETIESIAPHSRCVITVII
jgi:hypothetical protein